MMDLSAVNCFCEQLYEHYFSTDGWLPFQYKLWLMGLILRGEKGSRIILNLGEGVLISIVRYSIPKLELRDTTLILSWVMENCPAPILTSCCWTCPTTPLNSPSHHHHIIITSSLHNHPQPVKITSIITSAGKEYISWKGSQPQKEKKKGVWLWVKVNLQYALLLHNCKIAWVG